MKISKDEVEKLIDLVEEQILPKGFSTDIQSAKKVNARGAQKLAVRKLLDILCGLVTESVTDGRLPARETLVGLLKIYKGRRNTKV
jgi:hypothetical protein